MPDDTPRSIGLVLSGGGTRLFAHIGFLWALDDAGLLEPARVPLGAVVGNSAGSLVGAMLALGYTPREMWETAFWRIWGYEVSAEPRAWRGDARPRGLDVAIDLDFAGLARALTQHLAHFKGIDTGLRFEALLQRILERTGADGRPNPCFSGTRPPEGNLPLYLIGFNLTNRRETIFQFTRHLAGSLPAALSACETALGREASYEVCTDSDGAASPKELFRPWEGVRISTSLPLIFRPYYKPRFVATHWDELGRPQRVLQGAYLSDGGSRDNYSLSAAIKLAGCDAVLGCFLGDLGYPHEAFGHTVASEVAMRNIDGMMQAIFEADQDDAEISARPIRTVVPHIVPRPGVTFDLSDMGGVMEAGYIAAAYYLRRLRSDIADDREFLRALLAGEVHLTWQEVFAAGGETWGPAAPGRATMRRRGGPARDGQASSNYYIVQPPEAFRALAGAFFAEEYPGPPGFKAARRTVSLEEEIARRNRERREVAPEELAEPPFVDMPIARRQRAVVAWAERISWAAASALVGSLSAAILALWAVAGHLLHLVPAPDPVDMWAAALVLLVAAIGIGRLIRRAAVRYLWGQMQELIRKGVGF